MTNYPDGITLSGSTPHTVSPGSYVYIKTGSLGPLSTGLVDIYGREGAPGTVVNDGNIGFPPALPPSSPGDTPVGQKGRPPNVNPAPSTETGIFLVSGGSVTNAPTGVIKADNSIIMDGPGAAFNYGTMSGGFGVVFNDAAGVVVNHGKIIETGMGVQIGGGGGLTNATGAYLAGNDGVVIFNGSGSVANSGTINSTGTDTTVGARGAIIFGDGVVVNNASGLIEGLYGVQIQDGHGSVTNAGTIYGSIDAVFLLDGGAVNNEGGGVIEGTGTSGVGILLQGGTAMNTATNAGLVSGVSYGVWLIGTPGAVTNTGSIVGGIGFDSSVSGSTLTNAGSIVGTNGTAVQFAGDGNRLVVDPGAGFSGIVDGGNPSSILELAYGPNAGFLNGLGTSFINFGTVEVDDGASWKFGAMGGTLGTKIELDGASTAEFSAGVSGKKTVVFSDGTGTVLLDKAKVFKGKFSAFTEGDVIDLIGRYADGLSFAYHHLTLTNAGNVVANLHFAGNYTASDFALYPDNNGGTDVMLLTGAAVHR